MDYFLATLYKIDIGLLHWVNVDFASPALDQFWLMVTHFERTAIFECMVLPASLLFLFYTYRLNALKVIAVLALTVGLSDVLAYRGVKTFVKRPRPFQNLEISSWVRKVGDAQGPSFPSNHAANCFAAAVVLAWYFKRVGNIFYILAALVAISRVALGVHYPSDVLGGAILGITVGFLVRVGVLNQNKWLRLEESVSKSDAQVGHWRTRSRRL